MLSKNLGNEKNEEQVYVYDKVKNCSYPTNVDNIASKRYFYDIDFNAIISEKGYDIYGISKDELNDLRDDQTIENFLSQFIEGHYNTFLKKKIDRINQMNAWELNNCFFITKEEMAELSFYMAIQMFRVRSVRSRIENISDVFEQMLSDVGASSETINKYTSSPAELPLIQDEMILNADAIIGSMDSFLNKEWVLFYNQTNQPFFTSDNPIARVPHKKHPFKSMTGLNSEGIEIIFPLSPNMVLSMYDSGFHTYAKVYHQKIVVLDSVDNITWINKAVTINSERWIISQNNDFSLLQKEMNKKSLSLPPVELHYNGKIYTPRTNNTEKK